MSPYNMEPLPQGPKAWILPAVLDQKGSAVPFSNELQIPTRPGAFSPSEPCQEQHNIRKLFERLFRISYNPVISCSLTKPPCTPCQEVKMLRAALGRLEVTTSTSPSQGQLRGHTPRFVLPVQSQVCITSLAAPSSG